MEKSRPIGVTLLGWGYVVWGVLTLLKLLFTAQGNLTMGLIVMILIIGIICVAGGLGILSLKETMRKFMMFVVVFVPLFRFGFAIYMFHGIQKALSDAQIPSGTLPFIASQLLAVLPNIIISVIALAYLTRPTVKEQFK